MGYFLLLNFINLTANFYQASTPLSLDPYHQDPIDNITELVLEYILDMDGDTVPDTETPKEKTKLKDFKPFLVDKNIFILIALTFGERPDPIYLQGFFDEWEGQELAPPPKVC